jgi:enterochelin esterase family protein
MREPRSSILHLPATPPAPWDFQDVPHGAVHQHSYLSKTLQKPRELVVYTPPGYETAAGTSYPLLVLQHGSGDNEQTWVAHGKANWILDNLIAAGKARPMIVLMIDGHPLGRSPSGDPSKRTEAMNAFQRELFEDAIPLVEARYRVEKSRESRGIVGLSMGGAQSLTTGLGHLDRFAWVGSFSGAAPDDAILQPFLADPAGDNSKLCLLWIGVGKDDFLRTRNEELVAKLKQAGIHHVWRLSEGAHSWPVWREYLTEFAPLLFQPAKP